MTQLDPLQEVLFKSWARANGVEDPDDPNNMFDHRAHYQRTNGLVHPMGQVNQMADAHNVAVGAPSPNLQAQAKAEEMKKKLMGEQLKDHFKGADQEAEITKAKNNLHHLMLKRQLGI